MDSILVSPVMPPRREKPVVMLFSKSFGHGLGGGELSGEDFAQAFVKHGCEVFCVYHRGHYDGKVKLPDGVTPMKIAEGGLREAAVKIRPDILMSRGSGTAVQSAHVAEALHIPSVHYVQFWLDFLHVHKEDQQLHGGELSRCQFNDLVRYGVPAEADSNEEGVQAVANHQILIANSYFTANVMERTLGRKPMIAFPGHSPRSIAKDAPHYLEREYVLMTSVQALKGLRRFLALADHFQDEKFAVLSTEYERTHHKNEIAACVRRPNVEVLRWTDDMAGVYAKAKCVFIGTLTAETFSRVAVEARLSGCPVLCTDNGNLPNIVLDRAMVPDREYHEERRREGLYDPPENSMLGPGGVVVPQTAPIKIWEDALDNILCGNVQDDWDAFTDGFHAETPYAHQHRMEDVVPKILEVLPRRRVLVVSAGGPGVQSMCRSLAKVTGCGYTTIHSIQRVDTADYDLFLFSGSLKQPMAQRIAKSFPKRTVVSWCSHLSQMAFEPKEIQEWIDLTALVRADRIGGMVTSYEDDAATYQHLLTQYPADRFRWLPCTVGGEALRPPLEQVAPRVEPYLPPKFMVAVLGPTHPRKNLLVALAGIARAGLHANISQWLLRDKEIDAFLTHLMCAFASFNLHDSKAVRRMLQTCSAMVHLSHSETFSYASIEALLLGVPVIGPSTTPAHAYKDEFLQRHLWVDPNSAEQVAEKLQEISAPTFDLEKLKTLCREHAVDLNDKHVAGAKETLDHFLALAADEPATQTLGRATGASTEGESGLFGGWSRAAKPNQGVRPDKPDPDHPAARRGRARYRP
ncbi:hypothetical protein LCGC14_0165350 [marine sediment metagenome]|uniref:Glycosyl transferase family 1 domain-containing protein n=1 Tax=marine sediment metagenome TaxID=412755 RepID=A0A0F9XD22_9ZZZZ